MFKKIFLLLVILWSMPVMAEEVIEEIIIIREERSLWGFDNIEEYNKQYFTRHPLKFSTRSYYWGGAIGDFYQATQDTYLGLEFRQQYHTLRDPFYYDKYSRNNIVGKHGFIALSINFNF